MKRIKHKGVIFVQTGRSRLQRVDRGIVNRINADHNGVGRGESATDARISQIAAGNGQGIGAVIIGIRGIDQTRQRCIHLSRSSGNGDASRTIVAQGGPTEGGRQRPMGHTHRSGKGIHPSQLCNIHRIIDCDQVGMGRIENQGGIFVQTGRSRLQGIDRGIVDSVYRDGNGIGRGENATDARISQIVGGDGEDIGAVIIGVRGIDQSRQRRIHLSRSSGNGNASRTIVAQCGPTEGCHQCPMGDTHLGGKAIHPIHL